LIRERISHHGVKRNSSYPAEIQRRMLPASRISRGRVVVYIPCTHSRYIF